MGKVILKTALITVLSLLGALIFSALGIYAFAPRLAGDCCYELGLRNMATGCYERVYEKTGDFDDLVELVNSAIYAEDGEAVSVYGEEMVNRKTDFNNFCKSVDGDGDEGYSTYDYYVNSTMLAKYSLGNKLDAVQFAFLCALTSGYNENSALKMLVNMIATDDSLGELLKEEYLALGEKQWFTNFSLFREDMKELGHPIS